MKRKGPKVIQINGFKGLFFTAFIVVCLFAGFVIFPAKVAVYGWNYIANNYISLPEISLWQGLMLWAMIALSIYLLNNKNFAVSFQQPMELSDDEMKFLMERIQMQKQAQKLNAMFLKSNDIKILDKELNKDFQDINKTLDDNTASNQENENQKQNK